VTPAIGATARLFGNAYGPMRTDYRWEGTELTRDEERLELYRAHSVRAQ
jgi:hypothetical protein